MEGYVAWSSISPCYARADYQMVQYPKYTSGAVTRVVERNAKEYVKVAEAFIREDWKTVRNTIGVKEFKDVSPSCSLNHSNAAIQKGAY